MWHVACDESSEEINIINRGRNPIISAIASSAVASSAVASPSVAVASSSEVAVASAAVAELNQRSVLPLHQATPQPPNVSVVDAAHIHR